MSTSSCSDQRQKTPRGVRGDGLYRIRHRRAGDPDPERRSGGRAAPGRGRLVSIDLKPALEDHKLDARLRQDFATRGRETMQSLLRGLLPPQMVPVCLEQTGIAPAATGNQITAGERKRLRQWLKDFRLEVTGHRPLGEAIITAGGVDTREVDPRTMQSRMTQGAVFRRRDAGHPGGHGRL